MLVTNNTTNDYWFGPLHLAASGTLTVDDTSATSLYLTSDEVADAINNLSASGNITVTSAASPFPRPTGVPQLLHGDGSPEGLVFAPQGSLFMRRDNTGAPTALYAKTTGKFIDTGWQVISGETPTGWITFATTLTYSSADGHTFVCSTSADITATIPPGARIQLTHTSSTKYFLVTAVSSTTITLYGGTDYSLASGAITNTSYSLAKAPLGFPSNPAKWTEELNDTLSQSQSSPANGTWYNPGSLSLALPIGSWYVRYEVGASVSGSTNPDLQVALSTSNNSLSDSALLTYVYLPGINAYDQMMERNKTITVTSKTTYYLIIRTNTSSVTSISFVGNSVPTIVRAICAYL